MCLVCVPVPFAGALFLSSHTQFGPRAFLFLCLRIDIRGLLLSFRVLYHAEFNSCVQITIHCIKFPRIRLKLWNFLFTFPEFAKKWQIFATFCPIPKNSAKTGSCVQISVQFLGIRLKLGVLCKFLFNF